MVTLYGMTVRCDPESYKGMWWYARVDVGSWSGEGPQRYSEAEARADLPGVLRAAVSTALPPAQWTLRSNWPEWAASYWHFGTADGDPTTFGADAVVYGEGAYRWRLRTGLNDTVTEQIDNLNSIADFDSAKQRAESHLRAEFARLWVDANAKALGIEEV